MSSNVAIPVDMNNFNICVLGANSIAEFHVEMDFRQDLRNNKLKMLSKMLPKILLSFGRAIELAPSIANLGRIIFGEPCRKRGSSISEESGFVFGPIVF